MLSVYLKLTDCLPPPSMGSVACKEFWMSGANKVFRCPPTKKTISVPIHVENFRRPFFSHLSQFLLFLSLFFLNIFPDAPLILYAGAVLHFLRIYPYFFDIYLCIFSENSVVGCPPAGRPGPSHPPPPLHVTGSMDSEKLLGEKEMNNWVSSAYK